MIGKEENAGNQHFLLFLSCFLGEPIKQGVTWVTVNCLAE